MIEKKKRKKIKSIKNRILNNKYEMIKLTFNYFNKINLKKINFFLQIYNITKLKFGLFFNKYILFLINNYITKFKFKNIFPIIFFKNNNFKFEWEEVHNYINTLYYFKKYSKNSSISIIKNMCIDTTRTRGIQSFYKLSRLKLKEYGTMGLIPGIKKSSW